jgi:hypothetical protein
MVRRLKSIGAVGAVAALALSMGYVGGTSAFAASGPKGKTTCSHINGNSSTTVTISGCVDLSGANTGGGSHALPVATLAAGGTVTWNSNKSTTFSAATIKSSLGKKCPGYVKNASTNPSQIAFKGTVTAPDTAGFKIPGKYSGTICLANDGTITALKPLKVS